MGLRRELMLRGGLAAARSVRKATATPKEVASRTRVDPDWRRIEDGYAARLGTRETISMRRSVGHWRQVDPRRPHPSNGLVWKTLGVGLWGSAVGAAWWLGSSRGRGPLASVAELDRLGEAIGDAMDGFDEL